MIAIDDEDLKYKIMSRFKSIYINDGVEYLTKMAFGTYYGAI